MSENMEKNLENEAVEVVGEVIETEYEAENVVVEEASTEEVKSEEKRYPSYKERKRSKEEERKRKKEEERQLLTDIAVAQAELNALKKEYGLEKEEKGIKKAITNFFDRRDERLKVPVKKKTYIWLSVLLGWMGAHRFYSKQYALGILYLITCWSGIPCAMTIIDLMVIIPMQPDEDGYVMM